MLSIVDVFKCVTLMCTAVMAVFITILVINANKLTKNANEIASSIQKEIEPTLKELREASKSINSIAASADTQLKSTKEGIASFVGATSCLTGKLKSFATGILKGVAFGLGLFKK